MRRPALLWLALTLACSRETPAPPPPAEPATATTPPSAVTQTSMPTIEKGSYDEALLWMRSTPRFHFVLDDGGVHAEGDMTRQTVGDERVQFRVNGEEWLANSSVQGVAWKLRKGPSWIDAQPPDFGIRLFQRVTVAFDPQKTEGVPMLAVSEGPSNLYRFTDSNTGQAHEVWVNKADAHIERIRIGQTVDLRITP